MLSSVISGGSENFNWFRGHVACWEQVFGNIRAWRELKFVGGSELFGKQETADSIAAVRTHQIRSQFNEICVDFYSGPVCLSELFYSINSVKLSSWFMNPSQIGFSNKPATLLKTYNGFRKYWQCYAIHLLLDLYWQLKTNTYILETSICLEDLEKHFKYHCLKKKLAEILFGENSRRIFSVLWLLSIKFTCQSLQ